jgi:hypothetical protein
MKNTKTLSEWEKLHEKAAYWRKLYWSIDLKKEDVYVENLLLDELREENVRKLDLLFLLFV